MHILVIAIFAVIIYLALRSLIQNLHRGSFSNPTSSFNRNNHFFESPQEDNKLVSINIPYEFYNFLYSEAKRNSTSFESFISSAFSRNCSNIVDDSLIAYIKEHYSYEYNKYLHDYKSRVLKYKNYAPLVVCSYEYNYFYIRDNYPEIFDLISIHFNDFN